MKGLLEQVNALDNIIRALHKIDSRLRSGQIIDAWREVNRLIGILERAKQQTIVGTNVTIEDVAHDDK